jgi:hypothetical protein
MPFLSECTFCNHKVKAPDHGLGQSIPCPRCGNSFTLAPLIAPPAGPPLGLKARGRRERKSPLADMTSPPTPVLLTPPTAAPANGEERGAKGENGVPLAPRSPILDLRSFPGPDAGLPAAPRVNLLGALAFFLGSFALLFAQLSPVSFLAIPMAAAGALLGVLGLLIYWDGPLRQRVFPALGSVVSLVAVVVVLFWPDLLSIEPSGEADPDKEVAERLTVESTKDKEHRAADPSEWVAADKASLLTGGVKVRLTSVTVKSGGSTARGKKLFIRLRLINSNNPRRLDYRGWGGPTNRPHLRDDRGAIYRLTALPAGAEVSGSTAGGVLTPGKEVTDLLVFEPPAAGVKYLQLELPAAAFGGKGNLRWQIPSSMIEEH